jgi:hypothetical protein
MDAQREKMAKRGSVKKRTVKTIPHIGCGEAERGSRIGRKHRERGERDKERKREEERKRQRKRAREREIKREREREREERERGTDMSEVLSGGGVR